APADRTGGAEVAAVRYGCSAGLRVSGRKGTRTARDRLRLARGAVAGERNFTGASAMTGWRRLSLAGALAGFVLVAGSRALDALATPTAATVDPRATLQAEPLHGQAFVALVSADATAVPSHHEIVARRAPRSFGQRAWLADHYLRSGDHATALAHL